MKVKKILAIGLIGISIITSTGCSAKESKLAHDVMDTVKDKAKNFAEEKWKNIEDWTTEGNTENEYIDAETKELIDQAYTVVDVLKGKNDTNLLQLFDSNTLINHRNELIDEIKGAQSFISGKIISYDSPIVYPGAETTGEDGPVERYNNVEVAHVQTDKGKTYTIKIEICNVNKEKEELIGIDWIGICDEDVYTGETEYSEETVYIIGGYEDIN